MNLKKLIETPRIESGDWTFSKPLLGINVSENQLRRLKFAKNIDGEISLFKDPYSNIFFLIDQKFMKVIGIMELVEENFEIDGCKKIFRVESVEVEKDYRNKGLGYKFYLVVLKRIGGCLMTDEVLYKGSHKIWKKLIDDKKAIGIDLKTGEKIEVGDKLFGYSIEKKDLRLIIRESSIFYGDFE